MALKCFFFSHFFRPRTKTRRHQQEHQCIGISMTISIDAKCYYVPVFIMSGDRCLKDYGFRLSQAVDSAEVSYAMALLPSFCFSAAFRFELVSMLGGTKMYFSSCVHLVRSKTKTTTAPTSPSLEVSMAISIGAYILVFIRSH